MRNHIQEMLRFYCEDVKIDFKVVLDFFNNIAEFIEKLEVRILTLLCTVVQTLLYLRKSRNNPHAQHPRSSPTGEEWLLQKLTIIVTSTSLSTTKRIWKRKNHKYAFFSDYLAAYSFLFQLIRTS